MRAHEPRYWAIHEAGHAVTSCVTQMDLGWQWPPFGRVFLRSLSEIAAGPYEDDRGRRHHVAGMVERSERYTPLGKAVLAQMPDELRREARAAMEADSIVALAGPLAEARARRIAALIVLASWGSADSEDAERKIADFAPSEADTHTLYRELLARSALLVQRHWDLIVEFANMLRCHRHMTGHEAMTFVVARRAR